MKRLTVTDNTSIERIKEMLFTIYEEYPIIVAKTKNRLKIELLKYYKGTVCFTEY